MKNKKRGTKNELKRAISLGGYSPESHLQYSQIARMGFGRPLEIKE